MKATGTELGQSDCGECESEKSRVLIFNERGIFSVCKTCHFTEWEWAWSDNPEYLDHLAERFSVTRQQIMKALEAEA